MEYNTTMGRNEENTEIECERDVGLLEDGKGLYIHYMEISAWKRR